MVAHHTALIGLGSNLGASAKILLAAWSALEKGFAVEPGKLSAPYRSVPVGMDSVHRFINAVGLLRTSLSPSALLHVLQSLETRFGRVRDPLGNGYQDRSLDLDLLLYDDLLLETAELTLPHPRMRERRFVLDPLREILGLAGEVVLSPFDKPLAAWAEQCGKAVRHQEVERCSWPDVLRETGDRISPRGWLPGFPMITDFDSSHGSR